MNDFLRESQELRDQELGAVKRVLESGWYILGEEVASFEEEWAAIVGAAHAIGVGSGMDAIEIGLRALGIGPGDEVITTPMTAFATVLAIIRAGASPVLADIEPDSGLLSLDSVARCLSPATRAVLLVHLYGRIGDMTVWRSFCEQQRLLLLEDCAQAHLAKWHGQCAGSFGRFGAFSFYPTKNLGAIGDAGALTSSDHDLVEKARRIRNYGQSVRYHHPDVGLNSRLDEIHAAILRVRLKLLAEFIEYRRSVANAYWTGITNPAVELLARPLHDENHVHHLFVLRCRQRDKLIKHLKSRGIESLIHYPVPAHQQPPCLGLPRDPLGLANSESHAATCLSVPCHPQIAKDEIQTVIAAINEFH